jgi:large conductance mechanosensitive channel
MLKDFKRFVLRGNVVDLAVAVVIGGAFTSVVNGFVRDFLTPLLSSIQGKQDFSKYVFHFHNVPFYYGDFFNIALSFLLTAAVIFFFVVQPINRLVTISHRRHGTPEPTTRECPECLSEIPKQATRCKFCTASVKPETKPTAKNK